MLEYPTRATLWHDEATITVGTGGMAHAANTARRYNSSSRITNPATGNTVTFSVFLAAGTYTFSTLGVTATDQGIFDWYWNNAAFITGEDWYANPSVNNVVKTGTVVVPYSGRHVLKGVVNGKNASSSNFHYLFTKHWLNLASDTQGDGPDLTTGQGSAQVLLA